MRTTVAVILLVGLGSLGCTSEQSTGRAVGDRSTNPKAVEKPPTDVVPNSDHDPQVNEPSTIAKQSESMPDVEMMSKANPLVILDFDGIQKLIADQKGKVVVLDAWATYCPPCMRDFHHLVALHKKYGSDKVACVSLSFDYGDDEELDDLKPRLQKFLDSQGATFDNVVSSDDYESLYKKFDFDAIPAVFVYGIDGKLIERVDHSSDDETPIYDRVRTIVEKHLPKTASSL